MDCLSVVIAAAFLAASPGDPSPFTVVSTGSTALEGVSVGSQIVTGEEAWSSSNGHCSTESTPSADGSLCEGCWSTLGSGLNDSVHAIELVGSDIYAGGQFTGVYGQVDNSLNQIARWDGSSWSALGGGLNGMVMSIECNGSDIYVGGGFPSCVARWDGSAWYPIGSGMPGGWQHYYPFVDGVAVSFPYVYAGGYFIKPTHNIARWNGLFWSALGNGVSGFIYDIEMGGGYLYVGGIFNTAGGLPANNIARWDGSSWSALGSGVNGAVYEIEMIGPDLYVGGAFTSAGGIPANRIARWDGTSVLWHELGSGLNGTVRAIAATDSYLYAGGDFTQAGGNPASHIACWDGNSWSALGSGLNEKVWTIAAGSSDIYVGGSFTQAGGLCARNIAVWSERTQGTHPSVDPVEPCLHLYPNPTGSGTNLSFRSIGTAPLTLAIFDIAGGLVEQIDLGTFPPGLHTRYWDGCDRTGSTLASGVYLIRLCSTEFQTSSRVVLIR